MELLKRHGVILSHVVDDPGRRNGGAAMVKVILRLMCAATASAAAICFHAPASWAFGDAPWCAVINLGTGNVHWDCQYRTIEECVPNVVAGNRGFCNLNPWPGPVTRTTVAHPKHQKWHARQN